MPELTGQRKFLAARDARQLVKAKGAFWDILLGRTFIPEYPRGTPVYDYALRYSRIRSLPSREWHGRTLYLVHCAACGQRRGIPEYVLWHLVDPAHPICEYCARSSRMLADAGKAVLGDEFAAAAKEQADG